jgi:Glyoxalase-like domain
VSLAGETRARVDHLVVAAPTLAAGVAWCEARLGVTPGPGGEHPLMGTHNRLFNVSGERFPGCFFEIIAIDPAAPRPARARWFGLDEIDLRDGPRLIHFVARTSRLAARRDALLACGARPGEPIRASRATPAGLLQWTILVADDGRLDAGGAMPTLIEWDEPSLHPCNRLPASGVRLCRLTLGGLAAATVAALDLAAVEVATAGPAIVAEFDTPRGPLRLQT